ncbi:uncharacterized protein [Drosophila virilis]|uniref:Uncharacterized protein, isoform A n=1 Tax=Drosophila virilis TaxID=7244 RepID=B4LTR9_DROVI|nr:uncharacterized protein LOC6627901 [Drosophila virilis]XP_015027967.1 uncharacterized protein LOC6627901 [Drosophila virilis]EDW63970.1 uncharacterized protein Dvir_GJ10286, isoform A [Drosophila virilis]KRF81375.1 uncharacterized protein Dvir_GJ10286, isoform B [Drosophila virilis]
MGHQLSKRTDLIVASQSQSQSRTERNSRSSRQTDLEQETQQPDIAEAGEKATPIAEEALAEVRQIIIKIQLAKMEGGNDSAEQQQQEQQQFPLSEGVAMSADALNANEQILSVAVGAAAGTGASRTAGSSTEAPKTNERQLVNNNNLAGSVASASAAVRMLQLHDHDHDDNDDDVVVVDDAEDAELEMAISSLLRRRRRSSSGGGVGGVGAEGVEYCEVLEPQPVSDMLSSGAQRAQAPSGSNSNSGNSCCRSRSSKALATGAAGTVTSKRRCCKCKCRDALRGLRGMLESSTGSASAAAAAAKDKKEPAAAAVAAPRSKTRSSADRRSTPPTLSASSGGAAAVNRLQTHRQRNSVAVAEPSQLAIWAAPAMGDVIIRISSQPQPQFLMESAAATAACNNCNANTPVVTMSHQGLRLVASTHPDPAAAAAVAAAAAGVLPALTIEQPRAAVPLNAYGAGVTVHSQIDFMHCLVPDLERIINSSFYWGKMDRYEAERLLEGKPEGTFLLRDSAQEEFLFSVTFRKYGRSLHARIEQSGHKFSFDCHDPCVFAALTVTGLLEHYKDPSCVMFFEPCLTMPLHRRQTFSLQQLARATIVSNTTYDGINQLELPGRLKSYLKEYHYKQKLRVKPCDAHTPAPYYANI